MALHISGVAASTGAIALMFCLLVSESYITHIRILEDAAYPSTPPPAESPADNKKPRVIVVAVRKSGRVRMHKARENTNGSYSIGKTWVLDELTAIQSFTKFTPKTLDEQQGKERAGGVGFIITIQKPYYWQAGTPKEKDFFIYSLIKIFKKYTGGKLPELHGFDPQELEQFAGAGPAPGTPQARTPQTPFARENGGSYQGTPTFQGGRPHNAPQPDRSRQNGREVRPYVSQERSSRERPQQLRPSQERIVQPHPSQEGVLRVADSPDGIPHMPGSFPSSDFVRNLRPQDSKPQVTKNSLDSSTRPARYRDGSVTPGMQHELNSPRLAGAQSTESFRNRQDYQSKGVPGSGQPSGERSRQNGHYALIDTSESSAGRPSSSDRNQLPTPLRSGVPNSWQSSSIPQRERRASNTSPSSSHQNSEQETSQERSARSIAPEFRPSHSPNNSSIGSRQDHSVEPRPSEAGSSVDVSANVSGVTNGAQNTSVVPNETVISPAIANGNVSRSEENSSRNLTQPSLESSSESPADAQSHRPGLGPMIKTKSNQEVANKFRKAATAYNAFKPRVGGAGEKLRGGPEKSANENDGVSGVFPAPSITKAASHDTVKSLPSDEISDVSPIPKPDIQSPVANVILSSPPTEVVSTHEEVPNVSSAEQVPDMREAPTEERPRKRRSDHSGKYARVLGIDHSLLEGRTHEIETILDAFGWRENSDQKNAFEDIQLGLKKEIARVEAGSLLGAFEVGDERATAVGHMMDKVIAECEELDCLLTLYNVELGVSHQKFCI